jgi:hypothetical protein
MTVDEAGHRREALGVDDLQPWCGRAARGHRGDPAAFDDDGALLDYLTGADDDASIRDDEILRCKWTRPEGANKGKGYEDEASFHEQESTALDNPYP